MRTLRLLDVQRKANALVAACALDHRTFHLAVTYEDVELADERIAVHVALFHFNALLADAITLGPYARYATQDLRDTYRAVFRNVWAQWRYEQNLPDDEGPRFIDPVAPAIAPARIAGDALLAFCGGGKDSVVAAKLLHRGGIPFATLGYSCSIYGDADMQHALIERVAAVTGRTRAERIRIEDDIDAPLRAETPASVFTALPLALARGYRYLAVGHERSANTPNFVWNGEPVNHQWGKSFAAEQLLDRYIQTLADVRYFSLLQPVHDEVIFRLLARDAALAPLTHSCNVEKPWCCRCPKCVYVWLQMAAHLPRDIVEATFPRRIDDTNDDIFHALLTRTPFECVGSVPECHLAMSRAVASYPSLARFRIETIDPTPFLDIYEHAMPPHVAAAVLPQLRAARRP